MTHGYAVGMGGRLPQIWVFFGDLEPAVVFGQAGHRGNVRRAQREGTPRGHSGNVRSPGSARVRPPTRRSGVRALYLDLPEHPFGGRTE